jgi:DNA mismatch repair protein MutL
VTIRRLPSTVVNRIAAGEVVERPASAVKELVENAIDAGAGRIEVTLRGGGRALIAVADDGCGMDIHDLALAVERHATSKLADDDLSRIRTLGFRGEALPSIGSVARLAITSRPAGAAEGWRIRVEGGRAGSPEPAVCPVGTRVEVRDLFYATPARLKFLKAEATETGHAVEVINRLALAHPEVAFGLAGGERTRIRLPPAGGDLLDRLGRIMGRDFADNAVPIIADREAVRLSGYAGLPTLSRRQQTMQFLVVNGRPVRDKVLYGAVRAAYRDVLAPDRFPMVALFLDLPLDDLDVNVHPMKTEVRFRDPGLVRSLIAGALKHAIGEGGRRVATTAAERLLDAATTVPAPTLSAADVAAAEAGSVFRSAGSRQGSFARGWAPAGLAEAAAEYRAEPSSAPETAAGAAEPGRDHPLGVARAQIHATFIVAETADGLVIVDQHAAHERVVQERLKRAAAAGGIARQGLLIPEVVDLDEAAAARLTRRADELATLGLVIEPFGRGAVVVREVPAALGVVDVRPLVRDLADDLAGLDEAAALDERLNAVCASIACHGSVRAGRRLSIAEMNTLLRDMEAAPRTGQCSHGRPTHVELRLADIERLFGRR